jgi:2-(1,2-epoxy-1,2-dihydrophenyl)acetyl-CoA isomerase
MSETEITLEIRDHVARFTLNRPEAMNALRTESWHDMLEMVREVENNPQVRVLLLTGAGKNFCAGGNVKEFGDKLDMNGAERSAMFMRSVDRTNPLFTTLERLEQPFVVSVRGMAAGGGLGFVAAADLAIASDNARFLAAQIKIGAIADAGVAYNLTKNLGVKRAKQYCLLGEMMDARTALEFGLVNWVVPDAELETRTEELLAKLVKMLARAMGLTKSLINEGHTRSLAEHMAMETRAVRDCVQDQEFETRVRKFAEKR